MSKLAVIILTRNEEANIGEAMESAAFADEIVLVDSGSTDRTQELAEKQGAKFVSHPMDEEGFAGQRNFALTQTTADWVFYLDADERITPQGREKIRQIVAQNAQKTYKVERKNIVFGQLMNYGVHRPDYVARLFPRTAVKWQGVVHEGVQTDLPQERLTDVLRHYTYTSWQQYFTKFNRYTTLAAEELAQRGKRTSSLGIIGHAGGAFVKAYILKKGFLDGFLGFVMSFMAMAYALTKYLKLQNIYRLRDRS
ncbi:Glycosyl transferase family 2 [Selenomonas ruminantium]|uniref:Glycosyl transferase family 2 n=1 Tax=Selenomonas ruminantium TaxID=971 RepID=A0A1M6TF76_SELRU|nr:glycosyltransferase family 2 protein [Selenomonas ruminantium]SHK55601.1 Glycosyl transferase family 2 [Selenomonas ruminantium]